MPVLVVTKETGRELLKLVRENFREVEVEVSPNQKIQAISSPSSPLSWACTSVNTCMYIAFFFHFIWLCTCIILHIHICTCIILHLHVHVCTCYCACSRLIFTVSHDGSKLCYFLPAVSPLSPTPPTSIVKKGAVISNPKSAVKYVHCTLYILYNNLCLHYIDIIDIEVDIDIDIDIDIAGLKLKIKSDSGSQLYDFDYMSAPFSLSLRFVNWVDITNKEATYPHVRLHELSEEDSLSFFMSTMASIPATMAVVLINSQSGYDLGKKFNSEEQGSPVPMVVVTKETGKELLRLVEENPRKVTVKVELSPNAKPNSSPALSSPSPLGMCISCDAHVLYTCI